jgi:hypothetical protein
VGKAAVKSTRSAGNRSASLVAAAMPPILGMTTSRIAGTESRFRTLLVVACREDSIAQAYQGLPGHLADGFVIVGQQDRFRAATCRGRWRFASSGRLLGTRILHRRQVEPKQAAVIRLAVYMQKAVMLLDDSVDAANSRASSLPSNKARSVSAVSPSLLSANKIRSFF